MRTIILDSDYKIEATENQWILRYESVGEINPKTKKPTISRNEYFHNSLRGALSSYADKKLKTGAEIDTEISLLIERLYKLQDVVEEVSIKTN